MKAYFKRLAAILMSAIIALPVSAVTSIPVYADSEGRADIMYIDCNDAAVNQEKAETRTHLYVAPNYGFSDDPVNPKYKGMAFDEKTSTLTLNNVNAPADQLYIDAGGELTIKVEGTNKLGQIQGYGLKRLNFTGSGTLEVNAPYTGTIYKYVYDKTTDSTEYKAVSLSNGHIYAYALFIYSRTPENNSNPFPLMTIGDQVTIKLYGDKAAFESGNASSSSSSDSSTAFCAQFSFPGKYDDAKSKILQYKTTATPAVVWDEDVYSWKENEDYDMHYVTVNIPAKNLRIEGSVTDAEGNKTTISGNEIADHLYCVDENKNYGDSYYKISRVSDGFVIDKEDSLIEDESVMREPDESDGQFITGKAGAISTLPVAFSTDSVYAYKYKKGSDEYYVGLMNWLLSNLSQRLGDFKENDYSTYYIGKKVMKDSKLYLEDISEIKDSNSDNLDDIMKKGGYEYIGSIEYESTYSITNLTQTFGPASSQSTTGTGSDTGAAVGVVTIGAKTTTTSGDYSVTSTTAGAAEAEYTGNAKAGEKNVVIDETVKINGVDCKVTSIADSAFSGNASIESLTIPASVKTVGDNACSNIKTLKKVTFKGKNVEKIGANAFAKCPKLTKVVLPDSVTEIGKGAFSNDKKLGNLTVNGNNLKKIGNGAVKNIKKNAKITIKAKDKKVYNKVVSMFKKSGNKKLKFKFKKSKK